VAELIVAFDLASGREALALADGLVGLRWAKLGPVLFVREGPALVREFTARGIRVFLDLKWHDIPSTVAGAVAAARELGVAVATVHCLGGERMLRAARDAAGELALVGVTVLTSHEPAELGRVLGRGVPDLGVEAERLARLAAGAGLRGVVASGDEVSLVRPALAPDAWIVVPGVRLSGDAQDDQARTVTPDEAVQRGATHLVVGRSITRAADPRAVFDRVQASL
jgi:orotidine-5'-phosphate decarboxylase